MSRKLQLGTLAAKITRDVLTFHLMKVPDTESKINFHKLSKCTLLYPNLKIKFWLDTNFRFKLLHFFFYHRACFYSSERFLVVFYIKKR